MRLPSYMEWGNYGGPYHTSGNWYEDRDTGELKYNPGVAPENGLDAIFKAHDIAYGYTEIRLERGDITQEQATIEKMNADLQLIKNSFLYNPITDPLLPNDKILAAAAYCGAVVTAFTAKMLYDMDHLVSSGAVESIAAAGRLIEDLLSSDANVLGGIFDSLLDDILNESRDLFGDAGLATPPRRRDPLILDLDSDGIETTNLKSGAYFDHEGNGFAEQTGWADPDDGLLVRDVNGNGRIDSGKELFGDQTVLKNGSNASNGFVALADLDDNHDGKIDSNDAVWSQLKVWQDIDGDGYSTAGELKSLSDAGITAINLDSTPSTSIDPEGNTQTRIGSFEKTDGTTGQIANFNLQRDTTYTIAEEWLDVPEDIAALPDLQGFGNVYDLQQAIIRDEAKGGSLKVLVEQFVAETDVSVRKNLLYQIIFRWAGTDGIAANSRGTNVDARKLASLEKFFGQAFVGANGANPTSAAAIPLNESYRGLSEMFYAQLMAQTHLKDLYNKIIYTWDDATQSVKADMSAVVADIQAALAGNPDQGKALLSEFSRTIRGFGAQEMINYLSFRETFIMQDESLGWVVDAGGLPVIDGRGQGLFPGSRHVMGTNNYDAVKGSLTEGDGFLNSLVGSDVIYGTFRNETLINETGDAVLVAGDGNDRIWAGEDNDILDGGTGNDELKGESGNDTYIFRLGSGQDRIIDTDPTAGNTDTIFIGSNLTPNEISLKRIGNNLIVKINNTADTLTVQDYYKNNSPLNKTEKIRFMDGTIWDVDAILGMVAVTSETDDFIYGTSENDTLHGFGGNDTIYGASGSDLLFGDSGNDTLYGEAGEDVLQGLDDNDILYGADGNDLLYGHSGTDALYGDAGEDIIDGGEGADFLNGGAGNDTYIFNRNSGQDVISDTDMHATNINSIEFGADILPSDIMVERIGQKDMMLIIIGTQDSIYFKDCFLNIGQFKFTDGTVWNNQTVKDFLLTGTEADDVINGFSGQDIIKGMAGNDHLRGMEGDDLIDGGPGNDFLCGGIDSYTNKTNGNDTYIFGRGSGQDMIYERDITAGNSDTILMGAGISPEDVKLRRSDSYHLDLSINNSNDTLKIIQWFYNESSEWRVERIQFDNGTVWDVNTIKAKAILGTEASDALTGYDTDDVINGYESQDYLYGRGGDDVLSGGADNDAIFGEGGNDILNGDEGDDFIGGDKGEDILSGGSGSDDLYGGEGDDVLSGDDGDDFLLGDFGNDIMAGGEGNDVLIGNSGDDMLSGGDGSDMLDGGEGSDTFIFKAGSGQDVIRVFDNTVSNIDTILIEEGITTDKILIRRNANNLVVMNKETGDSITVENWFIEGKEAEKLDRVQFSDGTVWDIAMIKELALQGTEEADNLTGYATADILDGKESNDVLAGGVGNDTYIFGRGYGQDVVFDNDNGAGNIDTIAFNSDVLPEDIGFKRVDSDLNISIIDTDDSVTIKNWFISDSYKVEQIRFADNTVWDVATIETSINQPTDTDDYITGTPGNDSIDGGGGDDTIFGREGNDILYGGSGNDRLNGGDGEYDRLFGGEGDDRLEGESTYGAEEGFVYGKNFFDGGPGDDYIHGYRGENTVLFNRGSGFDTIQSHFIDPMEPSATGDTIIFGEGIKPEDLLIQANISYSDLGFGEIHTDLDFAIGIGNNEGMLIDALGVSGGGGGELFEPYDEGNGFTFSDLAIKRFVFADGQELTIEDIVARADNGVIGEQYGTIGDDLLRGSVTDDLIYANDGNDRVEALDRSDIVYAGSGDDAVSGGTGDDELYGGEGNDVIAGAPGGDYISGESGDNVYVFNRGDGQDYIVNYYNSPAYGGINTISYGKNIYTENIKGYLDDAGNLLLYIDGETDEICTPFYEDTDLQPLSNSISRVQFIDANGNAMVFDLAGIVETLKNDLIQAYDNGDDPVSLFTDLTSGFEITGTVEAAGGDYAVAYARTGDLFAVPTNYTGTESDDIINGRAGNDIIEAGNGNNTINAGDGDNSIAAGYGNDRITSGSGNDEIYDEGGQNNINTGAGNDWIVSGSGTDFIEAGEGNDVIESLGGSDVITGGLGDDTYYFNLGEGVLTINDLADATGGNRIIFGADITPDDLRLIAEQGVLTIEVGNEGDAVKLNSFDPQNAYGTRAVNTFEFDSGEILTYEQLIARGFEITGTETDDLISGTSVNDRIAAFGGDDVVAGGQGDDIIEGGSGNDTYLFNIGDGVDTIKDATALGAGNAVEFGAGITVSDLKLMVDENTLVVGVGRNGDVLRLEGFNPDDAYGVHAVEEFKFPDGTTINYADLLGLGFTFVGTDGSDLLKGTSADNTFLGGAGNDDINGGMGNDSYYFNTGDGADTIRDESSLCAANTLIFGTGITAADIRLSHDPQLKTLIITIGNDGESISLTGFDAADPYGVHAVEYFQFADGQILTYGQLINRGFDITGSDGDEILSGTGAVDSITGYSGNDTLSGGAGNDTLIGGYGDDTYFFNQGDGVDLIDDSADAAEGNTLVFGEGITLESMRRSLSYRDGNLIIRIGSTEDEVHLTGFDPEMADFGSRAVENFQFADGTLINYEQLVQNTFIVQGDSEDDNLQGTNVTDRLYGYEGSDSLNGGSGDDTLTGGTESDVLSGGAGDDTYVFNRGDEIDTIYDVASAGEGNLIYFGEGISREDLSISREEGILTINTGAAGDAIRLMNFDPAETSGSLTVRTIEFSDGTKMQITDLLGTEGDDIIITGSGDDSINGRGGNDVINTGEGSDILTGGMGNDILSGGAHNDTYIFNIGDDLDTINDTAASGEGNRILFGPGIAPNDVTLTFENTALKINVGSNGDGILLPGFDPNGAALAKVIETFEFENFTEITFADFIERYGIHITGTDGDDNISGTNVNDSISGLSGNDVINGGTGADVMTGGLGNDSYFVENAGDNVIESLNEGNDTVIASISYSLPENVDNLNISGFDPIDGTGNILNNTITGNFAANILYGNGGNDNLSGNAGDDTIYGEDGDDILSGGEGTDALTGGTGNDAYIFNYGDGVDTIHDAATPDAGNLLIFGEGITREDLETEVEGNLLTIRIGQNGDAMLLPDFDLENINGTHVSKTLQFADGTQALLSSLFDPGTEGGDVINTGPLDDVINAKGGDDIVNTDGGNDTITGGTGNDTIYAGSGNDMLTGNEGNDILDGGDGNDKFIYNDGDGLDRIDESGGTDTISLGPGLDFNHTIIRKEGSVARMRLLDEEGNETDKGIDIALNSDGTISVETVSFSDGNIFNTKDLVIGSQTTYGTKKSDFIRTGRNDDTIYAFQGGDTVYAGLSNDTIYGNNGRDKIYGEQGNDRLYGNNGDDILEGGGGNDLIDGGNGEDLLKGGSGNDVLYGGNGEDTLSGGAGDDIFYTGKGEDTVLFNPGDGHDTLVPDTQNGQHNCQPWNNDGDIVKFGVNPIDLIFSETGDELVVSINGFSDKLTADDWSSNYQVDKFISNNGRHLHDRDVDCLIQAMTAFGAAAGMTWSQAIQDKPQEVQQILARYWEG